MKRCVGFWLAVAALCLILPAAHSAQAKISFEELKDIALTETPVDFVFSRDGSTAYILGQKSIMIFSVPESKVTDTIPLKKSFSGLALSPDESTFFLAAKDSPQISLIRYSQIYDIEAGASPVMGNAKAPVSIVAFLDYQCPYCAKVYPLLQELLKKYPKDVKLIIKHFPLPMHKSAEKAAAAALAAGRQNKYEKINELFFANYVQLNDDTIRKFVQESGVDMQKYDQDIAGPEVKQMLQQDLQAGRQARVRAVPTIYINGIVPKGRSIEAYSQMVEEELKKKK